MVQFCAAKTEKIMEIVEIYTDGSSVDGQYGGYCALILGPDRIFSSRALLTNQQAELMAIELAFQQVEDISIAWIYTDSAFAIGCLYAHFNLTNSPWLKCIVDRIQDDFIHRHIHGKFVKVKSHADNKYNRLCDRVAQREAYNCKLEYK
jgi:ribonuclease HI